MLGLNVRKLFRRGRLYERESFFGSIVNYEIQGIIKIERYFKPEEKADLHDMLWYLFWTYEYHGQTLSARQISYLLGVDHRTIDRVIERIKYRIKNGLHL